MTHTIDPVAFSLFGLHIHWYGVAYMVSFILGFGYLKYLFKTWPASGFTNDHVDSVFNWILVGIILGGRLGYVLFYNPIHYLFHPHEILMTWTGGMSFHGGMLGVIIACVWYCRRHKLAFLDLTDRMAPTACIGLFLGRIGNFINGELYGHATNLPWGVIFPAAGPEPRHPSQLYEALLEGLVLFVILHLLARNGVRRGVLSAVFLIGYGIFRFMVEFVRVKDAHLTDGLFAYLSMGQLLCLPMIITGIVILMWSQRHGNTTR